MNILKSIKTNLIISTVSVIFAGALVIFDNTYCVVLEYILFLLLMRYHSNKY